MIGEVVQHILDKGFFVRFIYDGEIGYHFHVWKLYENEKCGCSFVFDEYMISQVVTNRIFIMETDRYLKQVDDIIAQRRLIDSVLK
jgi:hypothetical protein